MSEMASGSGRFAGGAMLSLSPSDQRSRFRTTLGPRKPGGCAGASSEAESLRCVFVSTREFTECVVAMAGLSGLMEGARLGGALASMAEPESDSICFTVS